LTCAGDCRLRGAIAVFIRGKRSVRRKYYFVKMLILSPTYGLMGQLSANFLLLPVTCLIYTRICSKTNSSGHRWAKILRLSFVVMATANGYGSEMVIG